MNKISLSIIANNFGENYDGVGAFATVISNTFSDRINKTVYTGFCNENDSKIKRLFTLAMTKAVINAANEIGDKQAVIIDYPFVEWNPFILLAFFYLKYYCKKNGTKFILSLHEYSRVSGLRKAVISILASISDGVFVSSEKLKLEISRFSKNIYIRNIPTNIENIPEIINKDDTMFSFFGLINKTKAFEEMLLGWDLFNRDGKYKLSVLTGTKIEGLDSHKNVEYLYKLDNHSLMKRLKESRFCIIPVIPEIDMKNATFKTGALAGCMCLGKFCEDYKDLPFVLNMKDYNPQSFLEAFTAATKKSSDECIIIEKEANSFGEQHTPKAISSVVENILFNIVGA